MKAKQLIIGIMMGLVTIVTSAQPADPHHSEEMHEKIKAQKVAFITSKLNLTPEEAQVFWPVYNQHHEELHKIHESRKEMMSKKKEFDELSDEEVMSMIEEHLKMRQEELDLDKKYHEEYKKVLSAKKLAKLYMAEEQFKKHLLTKLKGHHGKDHGHKGPDKGPGPGPDPRP